MKNFLLENGSKNFYVENQAMMMCFFPLLLYILTTLDNDFQICDKVYFDLKVDHKI